MTHKSNKDKTKPKAHVENSVPSFIRKTYEILEENKFPDIIDWNLEGNALVIKKPAEFCQKVLPAYFKHNNLTSFVRQLNMYNFHKRRTQNIDHVYYHELFQKGKKHLLKEIKRKNHDHSNDKHQKSPEANENSNKKELSSIAYENQMLKRLYNEALTKISALETQIQDATAQNQSLWSQISQTTESDKTGNPLTVRFDQQTIVSQQPSILQEITIPPLRFDSEHQNTPQAHPFAKPASGLKEEVTDSTATDGSHNSPSLHAQAESDKLVSLSEGGQSLQALQDGQAAQYRNDLFISKKETSVGYLFESWNTENTEIMAFADQKLDRPLPNFQAIPQDVLGKRVYDQNSDVKDFGSEPTKRHELSIFNRRNLISTGTEEKDPIMMRNDDYDTNLAVDLMDFNQPFC